MARKKSIPEELQFKAYSPFASFSEGSPGVAIPGGVGVRLCNLKGTDALELSRELGIMGKLTIWNSCNQAYQILRENQFSRDPSDNEIEALLLTLQEAIYASRDFIENFRDYLNEGPRRDKIEEHWLTRSSLAQIDAVYFNEDFLNSQRVEFVLGLADEFPNHINISKNFSNRHTIYAALSLLSADKLVAILNSDNFGLVEAAIDLGNLHSRATNSPKSSEEIYEERLRLSTRIAAHQMHVIHTYPLRDFAIEKYNEMGPWKSSRQASFTIFPLVQKYAEETDDLAPLSEQGGSRTVYEWIWKYKKSVK